MLLPKLLTTYDDDIISDINDVVNATSSLTFAIPEQVFQAFDTLTRYVGYIMPLRLYLPIIALVLGYWFLVIFGAATKLTFNLIKRVVAIFSGFLAG